MRLLIVSHLMTAAVRAAAFPVDEPVEPAGGVNLRPRPGTRLARGPELRCLQTCERMGLSADADDALRDWDLGRWRGRRLIEVAEAEPESVRAWQTDASAAPHGGESLEQLVQRVSAWLDGLGEESVVAVAHPAIARAAVVHALAADPAAFWRLDVAPGTVTSLSGRSGRLNVSRLGAPLLMN